MNKYIDTQLLWNQTGFSRGTLPRSGILSAGPPTHVCKCSDRDHGADEISEIVNSWRWLDSQHMSSLRTPVTLPMTLPGSHVNF